MHGTGAVEKNRKKPPFSRSHLHVCSSSKIRSAIPFSSRFFAKQNCLQNHELTGSDFWGVLHRCSSRKCACGVLGSIRRKPLKTSSVWQQSFDLRVLCVFSFQCCGKHAYFSKKKQHPKRSNDSPSRQSFFSKLWRKPFSQALGVRAQVLSAMVVRQHRLPWQHF